MPKTILVVGNDADLCTLLEYNLSRSGYRVELLHRIEGGLERARKLRPDLMHDRNVTERAVDVCVLRLRQKLGEDPSNARWVHSVSGFGYTFDPERLMN